MFRNRLLEVQWDLTIQSPNDAYNGFIDEFLLVYNDCFPIESIRAKVNKNIRKPWITNALLTSIKKG